MSTLLMRNISALASILVLSAPSGGALGQTGRGTPGQPEGASLLPPDPAELGSILAYEGYALAAAPFITDQVCPSGTACVFGSAGGVGLGLQRRWPSGIGVGLGYEVWFVDSNGVYELGVMHTLQASIRYTLTKAWRAQPFLNGAIGVMALGDTIRFAAIGPSIDLRVGVEIELTQAIALMLAIPCRFFSTGSFVTPRDRVSRADDFGGNATIGFLAGLVILDP